MSQKTVQGLYCLYCYKEFFMSSRLCSAISNKLWELQIFSNQNRNDRKRIQFYFIFFKLYFNIGYIIQRFKWFKCRQYVLVYGIQNIQCSRNGYLKDTLLLYAFSIMTLQSFNCFITYGMKSDKPYNSYTCVNNYYNHLAHLSMSVFF